MNNEKNRIKWVEQVHDNLKLRGRSEKTFDNYKSALIRFFKYYSKDIIIKKLNEREIIKFLKSEYLDKNKCGDSYNVAVCAITLMFSVCFNISLNRILLPNTKLQKRMPKIITKDLFLEIFNNEKHLNHKCWLLLSFCSGLRVEEIATIKIENINSKEHKLKILGKGNKERITILPDIVIKFLRLYYKEQHITLKQGYLFKGTNQKEHMNEKTIINYFTSIKYKYKLDKNISFHCLRHSFATYYLANGGSLLTLKSMLGHKSLNTTTIYLHLSQNFNELEGINYV